MLQVSVINKKYVEETMQRDKIVQSTQKSSGKMMPLQPFLYVNSREHNNTSYLESACKTEYNETISQACPISSNEELLPVRMMEGSVYYSPAFRLDENNVCAEVSIFLHASWHKEIEKIEDKYKKFILLHLSMILGTRSHSFR
jgi:hypothetical protein